MIDFLMLPEGLIERLGWVLIYSVLQFPLCALLLVLVERIFKAKSAATKYLASLTTLAVMVTVAAATFVLVGPQGGPPPVSVTAEASSRISDSADQVSVDLLETAAIGSPTGMSEAEPQSVIVASIPAVQASGSLAWASQARVASAVKPWLPACVLVWAIGVTFAAMRLLAGGLHVYRLRRYGLSPVTDEILQLLNEMAERLRLRVPVSIRQSSMVAGPVVIGWLRPLILLPASVVTGLSSDQLAAVLAHELAHIHRRDYLFNLLQTLVETVFFYHPAVWWVSHRTRCHREDCCDDLALAAVAEPVTYASALLALHEGPCAALTPAATGGKLTQRIHRILGLNSTVQTSGWGATLTSSLVVLVAGCTLLGCGVLVSGADDESPAAVDESAAADDENQDETGPRRGESAPTAVPLPPAKTPEEIESLLKQLESLGVSRSTALNIQPTAKPGTFPYKAQLWDVPDAAWPILERLPSIQHLEVTGSRISPEAFRHIRGLRNLLRLIVVNSRFEPQHLESLAELKHLRELNVMLTVFELTAAERIRQLGQLTSEEARTFVEIAGPDRRLSHIAEATVLTDRALTRLAGHVKLETLKLVNTYVSPTGLQALRDMRKLKELEFACRPTLSRETTRMFDGMEDLAKLTLTGSLDPAAAAGLKHVPKLSELSIFGVTDEVAAGLAESAALTRLSLWSSELSDGGLEHLAKLEKLEQLDIRHAHRGTFSLEGIAQFQKARPGCAVQHSLKVDALAERPIPVASNWYVTGFYWRGATTRQSLRKHVEERFGDSEFWREFQPFTRKGYIGGVALLPGKAGQAWLQKEIGEDEDYEIEFSEPLTAKRLRDEGILFAATEQPEAQPNGTRGGSDPARSVLTPQSGSGTGNTLPPFPVLVEQLRESQKTDAADFLTKQFELQSRYVDRNPQSVIAYGRVIAPPGEPPRLCNAQMTIHSDGWFVGGIGDKDRPVGFRMFGCRAVDLIPSQISPGLRHGESVSLGRIVMERFPTVDLATVRGRLKFGGGVAHRGIRIRAIIQGARTNSSTGGTDGSIPWPEKENVTLAEDLQFEHRLLAPLPHRLHIEAPGHRIVVRDLELTAGDTLDLGTIDVPVAPKFEVEFLASMTTDFSESKLRTETVPLEERWRSNPENPALAKYPSGDMSFRMGRLRLAEKEAPEVVLLSTGVASLKLVDLGQSDLTSLRRKIEEPAKLRSYHDVPIKSGHVYLTYHTHWKHWTLLRVKFENP